MAAADYRCLETEVAFVFGPESHLSETLDPSYVDGGGVKALHIILGGGGEVII